MAYWTQTRGGRLPAYLPCVGKCICIPSNPNPHPLLPNQVDSLDWQIVTDFKKEGGFLRASFQMVTIDRTEQELRFENNADYLFVLCDHSS